MSRHEESRNLTRSNFLRLAALGAGGLGLTALGGCGPQADVPQASPSQATPRGYVVTVTHGPQEATRVMLALVTASLLPPGDNHVWFAIDGGLLCKRGEAEQVTSPLFTAQGDAAKMLEEIRSRGTALHI